MNDPTILTGSRADPYYTTMYWLWHSSLTHAISAMPNGSAFEIVDLTRKLFAYRVGQQEEQS